MQKKSTPICTELVFKVLLLKLATECKVTSSNIFYKQNDGCAMPGPLSVTFSDIYMLKPENDILLPIKPRFYRRYVDDIFTKRKVNMNNILLEQSNNYHPKIKLAIELNRNNFLDTKLICINSICNTIVN